MLIAAAAPSAATTTPMSNAAPPASSRKPIDAVPGMRNAQMRGGLAQLADPRELRSTHDHGVACEHRGQLRGLGTGPSLPPCPTSTDPLGGGLSRQHSQPLLRRIVSTTDFTG